MHGWNRALVLGAVGAVALGACREVRIPRGNNSGAGGSLGGDAGGGGGAIGGTTGNVSPSTATVSSSGGGGATTACALDGVPDPTTCAAACDALYQCGLLVCDGERLCPGWGAGAGEIDEGTFTAGCEENCAALTALILLSDPSDCLTTVTELAAANATFKDGCENGEGGAAGS